LEQVLRKLLQAPGQPSPADTETPSGSHPEPELVAAFAEGRLRGCELQSIESHLAACLPCRGSATALFESLGKVERPRSQAIFEWRRWMGPAPALAAALMVGSILYYQRGQILRRGVQPARSNAQNGLAPASGQTSEAAEQKTQESGAAVRRDSNPAQNSAWLRNGNQANAVERVQKTAPGNGGVISPVAGAAAFAPQGARAASGGAAQDGNTVFLKEEAEQAAARAQQSAIQNKPLSGKAEENRGPEPLARESSEKGQPPTLKKTLPAPTTSPARSPAFSAGVVGGIAGGWPEPVAALPGGAPLRAMTAHDNRTWAISDSGKIFRSLDFGRTWIAIPSPTAEDLVSIRWDPATNSLLVRDKHGREYKAEP
jgi:hypothetical protein